MPLNNHLKEYRMRHGISQEMLGRMSHTSRQTVSKIECGSQTPSVVLALHMARVFQCSVANLFEFTSDE